MMNEKPKRRGQPPKPEAEKRVAVAYRLAPDVVEILRNRPNASRFIDEAVRNHASKHPIIPPDAG